MTNSKRNRVLLIHGIFLLIVTSVNTVQSVVGLRTGAGIFGFLKSIPLAEVGLFQAYLLMMLIGIVLLMNTRNRHSWKYDLIGVFAHLIPLSALIVFNDVVEEVMGHHIVIASSVIHVPWIIIESIAAFVNRKKAYEKPE